MSIKIEVDFKNISPKKIERVAKRLQKEIPKGSLRGLKKTEGRIRKELTKYISNITVSSTVRTEDPAVTTVTDTPADYNAVLNEMRGSNFTPRNREQTINDLASSRMMSFREGTTSSARPKGTSRPFTQSRYAEVQIPHGGGSQPALDAYRRFQNTMSQGFFFYDSVEQRYYYLNSQEIGNLDQYIKIKCSTDSGLNNSGEVSEKTQSRYLNELGNRLIGNQYTTWTIKNEGIQAIINGELGMDVTDAVHALQAGDPELALSLLQKSDINTTADPIQQLMDAGPAIAQNPYSMLKSFINGLHWEQTSYKTGNRVSTSKFGLISSYGVNLQDIEAAFDKLNAEDPNAVKLHRQTSEAIHNIRSALMVAKDTYVPEKATEQIIISVQRVMKSLES